MKILLFTPLLVLPLFLSGCNSSGCTTTEQQQVAAAIDPTVACVVDAVMQIAGTEEIAGIVENCPVAAKDIYQIIVELLAQDKTADAGTVVASTPKAQAVPFSLDAGKQVVPSLTPELRAHLCHLRDNAKKLMDAGQ